MLRSKSALDKKRDLTARTLGREERFTAEPQRTQSLRKDFLPQRRRELGEREFFSWYRVLSQSKTPITNSLYFNY